MDGINLGVKQTHLGCVRNGKALLEDYGLTPARYNMLYAIRGRRFGVVQSELTRVLGYHRSTTQRMLASLERLGLVARTVDARDARTRLVQLTVLGSARIEAAIEFLTSGGVLDWATYEMVSPMPGERVEGAEAIRAFHRLLLRCRHRVGDFATLSFDYDREYIPDVALPLDEYGSPPPYRNAAPRGRARR